MGTTYLPTKNNLIKLKKSIKQYQNGQKLLEEKELILKKKLENYKIEEKNLKIKTKQVIDDAENSLKKANVDVGFDELVDISNAIKDDNTISIKYLTLMGVEIPSLLSEKLETKINYGLYHTTVAVDETIIKFIEVKKHIIKLAEIGSIIIRLQKAIEKVERRANALREVIIPRDELLAKKIGISLDEAERDEFVRLKVVKNASYNLRLNCILVQMYYYIIFLPRKRPN